LNVAGAPGLVVLDDLFRARRMDLHLSTLGRHAVGVHPRAFTELTLFNMKTLSLLGPVERSPLWDQAYASLRNSLMSGRFAPGQKILLRDVAEQMGISLTPVRDAVNRLVAERVLERGGVGQGGGATVPLMSADQFRQLMEVRAGLEPVAAAAAVRHATEPELDRIDVELEAMQSAIRDHRTEDYLAAHYRFHFGIYSLCRMPIVMEIIESAWLRCAPTLLFGLPHFRPTLKRYPFHVATLKALRAGHADVAAAAIRSDIESARDDICAALELMEAADAPRR
jgi:DNA-binding GntR family transcriptional regulator